MEPMSHITWAEITTTKPHKFSCMQRISGGVRNDVRTFPAGTKCKCERRDYSDGHSGSMYNFRKCIVFTAYVQEGKKCWSSTKVQYLD